MKLGILLGYSGGKMDLGLETVKLAETLGYDSAWTAEAYGSDAVSPAAWVLAQTTKIKVGTSIMQIPARTPACTAMTAMSLNDLSGGRFLLGLGPSGPQVAEGWHGVPYGKPMVRIKEYIQIIREILKREKPLEFHGEEYDIPYTGPRATGLGKPLKSILHGDPSMPIYTAAITPAGVRTAAEVADGFFPIWMDPSRFDVFQGDIETGLEAGGKSLADFDVAPFVNAVLGDDVEECRNKVRPGMALYIGGMGARSKNFYNDYAKRLGFEDAAVKIQDLFLSGQRAEAAAAVPAELVDAVALCGPKERIRERLAPWKQAAAKGHVGSMLIGRTSPDALKVIAEEML
ncbi:MAG: LLM class F420-dependent oxidoreductase [Alphaproteobacteria bacterium]|nr:LLM class F420-dependent oxidoreductase [Alphaproteobacteria bacterium]